MKLSNFYIPAALMFSSTGFFYVYGWVLGIVAILIYCKLSYDLIVWLCKYENSIKMNLWLMKVTGKTWELSDRPVLFPKK